ncbi:MAG: thermonuclease family protein [Nanoarchaeota archaeon]|nr:thermonuclease family protein [Nanoarchaeota archaeon]
MDKKGSSWWTWFWIILFLMIMTSVISNSFYRRSMYRQMMYDDMYEDQLQQQLEDDMMRDLYRDQMRDDMYNDMMYDDMMRDLYKDDLGRGTYENYYPPSQNQEEQDSESEEESKTVSSVSDGDTIKLSNGETIRLIGLNAPESGQSCSSEATDKLKEFVLGKEVILEQDVDDKDQYSRLLRYVYVDSIFVNLEMVRLGLAHKYEYGSNTKYSSKFEQAENEAKQNEGCLWKSEEVNYIQDKCIYITNFHFNAAGNDNYNLNDEYVTFGNKCSYSIGMDSWTIKDETASHIYTIPSFTFQSGATFTLYTGRGTNTNSVLYWGRTSGDYAAIWNNGGDTLFLRDSKGNLVLSKSYSGY